MLRRRSFLKGCSALMALAATRVQGLAMTPGASTGQLVVLSLRGGWDALSVVFPNRGQDWQVYRTARPGLARESGPELSGFSLHPALSPLWKQGQLGVVLATGLKAGVRSHFEAIATMEAGEVRRRTGWLGRYLHSLTQDSGYPGVSLGTASLALQGYPRTLTLDSLADLDFQLPAEGELAQLYAGPGDLQRAGREALVALQQARKFARQSNPCEGHYPDTELAGSLRETARLLRCPELGVRVVTLEMDGWDTHSSQAEVLPELLGDLATSLVAFLDTMQSPNLTVVVMSEFGRRLSENASGGTDHGHGSVMLVLGQGVRKGLHGRWPGLAKEQLYDLEDLEVVTDYRDVLGQVLTHRLGCRDLTPVFPGWTPSAPLDLWV